MAWKIPQLPGPSIQVPPLPMWEVRGHEDGPQFIPIVWLLIGDIKDVASKEEHAYIFSRMLYVTANDLGDTGLWWKWFVPTPDLKVVGTQRVYSAPYRSGFSGPPQPLNLLGYAVGTSEPEDWAAANAAMLENQWREQEKKAAAKLKRQQKKAS